MFVSPLAHVKWFTDPSRHPTDYALLLTPPVIAAFVIALAVVGAAWLIARRVPEPRLVGEVERFAGLAPLALRLCVGIGLVAASLVGLLFVPSLRVERDGEGLALLGAELVVGLMIALGLGTRIAALGLAVLGAVAMIPFSLESILEQVHLLGAAVYLFVIGRGALALDRLLQRRSIEDQRAPRFALNVLRVAMGFGIAFGALTEKLLDPALSAALLSERPELNVLRGLGVGDPQFIYLAGLAELVIGAVIISGQLARPVMAVGAVLFTITLPLFGWYELLGHLPYYGMFFAIFLAPAARSPRVRRRQLRRGRLLAPQI